MAAAQALRRHCERQRIIALECKRGAAEREIEHAQHDAIAGMSGPCRTHAACLCSAASLTRIFVAPPDSDELIRTEAEREIYDSIHQLQRATKHVQLELEDMTSVLLREQATFKQHQEIERHLRARLASLERAPPEASGCVPLRVARAVVRSVPDRRADAMRVRPWSVRDGKQDGGRARAEMASRTDR